MAAYGFGVIYPDGSLGGALRPSAVSSSPESASTSPPPKPAPRGVVLAGSALEGGSGASSRCDGDDE
eukprot:1553702-Pyramimonas_sp.AAC.1